MTAPANAWQRVAIEIAHRIRSGDTPVGSRVGTYRQFAEQLHTSLGSVKRAVEYLAGIGVVQTLHGSGVYAVRMPDEDLDFTRPTVEEIADRVADLEKDLDELKSDRADLRETVGVVQAQLIELYSLLGHSSETSQPEPRRAQRRRAASE